MVLTRYGMREWLTATVVAAVLVALFVWLRWWPAAGAAVVVWLAVAWFFRDPIRRVPGYLAPETMLSPADGTVSAVIEVPAHEAVEGPATIVRIFLSVLNVHVNRAPCDGRVTRLVYARGRFHDARTPASAVENEAQLITVRLPAGPAVGVRQIAGKVARRIVCDLSEGDQLRRGERFGMIKFGSSAELILPQTLVAEVHVRQGDKVRGGLTKLVTLKERSAVSGQRSAGVAESMESKVR
ncbi:MAG: phosphatidylserine decarboxylase [Planctomycetota bacterium]|jgi:phosphatidylserine decarboxylase